MSQERIQRLRTDLEEFSRTGEIKVDGLAPDFEMRQAASIIDTAGVFHGAEGLRGALSELQRSFEELSFEGERFFEAPGGEIVAFIRVRGRGIGSGVEIDNQIAWVWTFRGGEAIRLVVYEEPGDALEAVGLRE